MAVSGLRWRKQGKLFSINHGGRELYPAFQLGPDGRPLPIVAELLEILARVPDRTEWDNALWFAGESGWLDGKTPLELLQSEPELVTQGLYRYVKPGMARQPIAAASLRRAIAAIGAVHRALKYPDPTIDEDVRATIKINVAGRQVQSHKDPLRWGDLERAFANMGEDLHALRD
jgi:hypothetical protein